MYTSFLTEEFKGDLPTYESDWIYGFITVKLSHKVFQGTGKKFSCGKTLYLGYIWQFLKFSLEGTKSKTS